MISGNAISNMFKGFLSITSPWNEKIIIKVSSNPVIVELVNFFKNTFSKNSNPFLCIIIFRVIAAEKSGITTNNTIDNNSVAHGIAMPVTPNSKLTSGKKATKIIKSLIATCTKV